jgi:outer membrane protein assembly factor BamA
VDEARLHSYFDFGGTGLFGGGRPLFIHSRVEAAATKVEGTYLLEGYLWVEVDEPLITWRDDDTVADVRIVVRAGPRFLITDPKIGGTATGALLVAAERIASALDGKPYHVRMPAQALGTIQKLLLDRGHQRCEVSVDTVIDEQAGTVALTFHVAPGPVVYLDGVTITGLDRTSERFVRGLLDLEEDQEFRQNELDEAIDRLYLTGLFGSVRMVQEPLPGNAPAKSSVVVELQELEARSVDLELGWGSYELLRGAVRYRDRNLLGAARDLDARLSASLKSAGIDVGLTDDYLLGRRNRLELVGGLEARKEPSYDTTRNWYQASVRHLFNRRTSGTVGYRFDASKATSVTGAIPGAERTGFVTNAGLFSQFQYDSRDNPLIPHDGWLAEIGVFWSTPVLGADLDFLELAGSVSTYIELGENTVLAFGVQYTTRKILDGRPTLPIQDRLFSGGDSTVRSFYEDELGPVGPNGKPVGGLTSAAANMELRQRLVGNLEGALFGDVGTVGTLAYDLRGPYGYAVGVGLRYLLPVGPARLDFGWNPGRRFAARNSWALHFSFGFSF